MTRADAVVREARREAGAVQNVAASAFRKNSSAEAQAATTARTPPVRKRRPRRLWSPVVNHVPTTGGVRSGATSSCDAAAGRVSVEVIRLPGVPGIPGTAG